jgi:hypothetical protein
MRYLLAVLCLLVPSLAAAQTCPGDATTFVVNPTGVCFEASPDHDATSPLATSVAKYVLKFYSRGVDTTDPTSKAMNEPGIDLGKPTPVGPNRIISMQRSELGAVPIGMELIGVVEAVGTNGAAGRSAPGNPFGKNNPQAAPRPSASAPIIFRQ